MAAIALFILAGGAAALFDDEIRRSVNGVTAAGMCLLGLVLLGTAVALWTRREAAAVMGIGSIAALSLLWISEIVFGARSEPFLAAVFGLMAMVAFWAWFFLWPLTLLTGPRDGPSNRSGTRRD